MLTAAASPRSVVDWMLLDSCDRMIQFSLERQDLSALRYWQQLYDDLARVRAARAQPVSVT